jgi:hypothetical protein
MTAPVTPTVTLLDVHRFCRATGLSASTLGRLAIGDAGLVIGMRNGRQLRPRTAERVRAFMADQTRVDAARCPRRAQPARGPSQPPPALVPAPDPILAEIAVYLAATGMSGADFGVAAIGDPNLVGDLRRGREPRRRTLARIRHFIEHGED